MPITMKIYILLAFLGLFIFNSCQFNQSVNKDLTTGAYSRGDGITCDNVVLQINGKTENRNEFIDGETVKIIFENVNGLTRIENKTYPEMSMFIVKNEQDTIKAQKDILYDAKDGVDIYPLQLSSSFIAALPYQNGEKYKVIVQIKDKKGKGKFTYSLPFQVKPNEVLKIENNGLKYKYIYLWDEDTQLAVVDNHLYNRHKYDLVIERLNGFKVSEGKVFPILSLRITDKNQQKILDNPNLLKEIEQIGIKPDEFEKNPFGVNFILAEKKINNPYKLTLRLKDILSGKELNIKMDFTLEEE